MTEFTAVLRGSNFRPIDAQLIVRNLEEGQTLELAREASNQFDPNAIMVIDPASTHHIGYVAKEVCAAGLAQMMDEGREFTCTVESIMMKQITLLIQEVP